MNRSLLIQFFVDEEQEEGEPDLHQCGHCKLMFNNLKRYITHKVQKECWTAENEESNNGTPDDMEWRPDQNGSTSSPENSPTGGEISNSEEVDDQVRL